MPLNISSYTAPQSLKELWQLLQQSSTSPILLSGGIELLLRAREGYIPSHRPWIDLTTIPELCGVRQIGSMLWIGASTTYSQLASNPLVQQHATALSMSAAQLGSWQIRNRSTLGGNASRGGSEADMLPSLYALNARMVCNDGQTERQLPCEEFYTGPQQTALNDREVLTGVLIPIEHRYSVFLKLKSRTVRSTAKVSLAMSLYIHNEHYSQACIALGAVSPSVVRARSAEGLLEGQPIAHTALLDRVADEIRRAANPITDLRSSARYRKWSVGILAKRSLALLLKQHQTDTLPSEGPSTSIQEGATS